MSENDDGVLYEATVAANLSELFNAAREEAVQHTASVLILVDTEEGMNAYTNVPGPVSGYMASAYHIKSVLEAYPNPLEEADDD